MKDKSLIKENIKQKSKNEQSRPKSVKKSKRVKKPAHPDFGEVAYNVNIAKQKYVKTNTVIMSILTILLVLTLIRFVFTFHHWLVLTIAFTASFCCILWVIFAIKRSMVRVELCIYEKYLVKHFEDSCVYCEHKLMSGYKIKTNILDKLFKPKTKTLIVYYNNKVLPYVRMSCIDDDMDKIIDLIIKLSHHNSQQ